MNPKTGTNEVTKKIGARGKRKRGRPKTAGNLDEAIYGKYSKRDEGLSPEFDSAMLVQETFYNLRKMPKDEEDCDNNQLDTRYHWNQFVGDLVTRAILEEDFNFFYDIARILEECPPDDEGGWRAAAPDIAEELILRERKRRKDITAAEFDEEMAKLKPQFGDRRRTNARRAKAAGLKSRPRGRPKRQENK